jgi:hypothetical protein
VETCEIPSPSGNVAHRRAFFEVVAFDRSSAASLNNGTNSPAQR